MREEGRPFLGICVGMQLMATRGLEYATSQGLDWIHGDVKAIAAERPVAQDPAYGLEHAGSAARRTRCSTAFPPGRTGCTPISCIPTRSTPSDPDDVVATADYGGPVTAIVARDNIVGTQFHPEKSQALGLKLIANFLRWRP